MSEQTSSWWTVSSVQSSYTAFSQAAQREHARMSTSEGAKWADRLQTATWASGFGPSRGWGQWTPWGSQ